MTNESKAISFYIPSTKQGNIPINETEFSNRVDSIAQKFSSLFGGGTVTNGLGFYLSNSGELIKESVKILTSFTDSKTAVLHYDQVLSIAKQSCKSWSQESILVDYNGRIHFIEND